MQKKKRTVICDYCKEKTILVPDTKVYGRSYGGKLWICVPCDAWVGCHKGSKDHAPLGRLANDELRRWKIRAHAAFDPLWKAKIRIDKCSQSEARKAGYVWLANELGIELKKCHIGYMDVAMCEKVVKLCKSIGKEQ
jgi:hypothetical protein